MLASTFKTPDLVDHHDHAGGERVEAAFESRAHSDRGWHPKASRHPQVRKDMGRHSGSHHPDQQGRGKDP